MFSTEELLRMRELSGEIEELTEEQYNERMESLDYVYKHPHLYYREL